MEKNTLLNQISSFIKGFIFVNQCDKRNESEQQMLQRVGRKFGILFFVILIFDTLLDWFLGLIDIVIHLIHIIIEAIEYLLEVLLENIFHIEHHQSEAIIVNGALIITFYLVYRFSFAAPDLYVRFKRYCLAIWLRYIKRESSCWQAMSLVHKIKWVSAYSFGAACLFLLVS